MYDFYLMHENTKVLKFNITTDINIFTNLCEFEIINKKYLPYPVKLAKEEDREATFWLWFTTRYMDRHQEGFLDFTNFLHNNFTNRGYKVPYFCSLFTYGMSMNDHYWLNPVQEIELGRVLDAGCPYKFKLLPTVYDTARSNFLDWDDDIEKIMILTWKGDYKELEKINHLNISLSTPNFTTTGDRMKMWKKENDGIICEKFYKEKDISKMQKALDISAVTADMKHFITKTPASEYSIKSKYFLKDNEEFVTLTQFLMGYQLKEITDLSIYQFLRYICLDAGMYKEYLKERDVLKEKFGITDMEFWEHLGFIVDSKSQRIIGIMNTL